jgi:SAM-dependent methyltransferase
MATSTLPLVSENKGSDQDKAGQYTAERVRYWNRFHSANKALARGRKGYQSRLAEVYGLVIPPGMTVLELGCGNGDLLASLKPAYGVGIDFSMVAIEQARERHSELMFVEADVHSFDLNEKFDYIICSDLMNDLWDVQQMLERLRMHSHSGTRFICNAYSRLWQLPRLAAEAVGFLPRQLPQNWLTREDISNLAGLAGWEVFRAWPEVLLPFRVPFAHTLANKFLAKVWPIHNLAISNFLIARPQPERRATDGFVSVVVAARNEEGNIANIFDRVPQMGLGTELIFVEGNSKDDTFGAIEREIARRPGYNARLYKQPGKGKGDAVRKGFAEAKGDLLMILDADLTVAPEDLPRFYEAWRSGKAEFVNGVRLVYPMDEKAMRFFNLVGNRFFSLAFSWLLSQNTKDTLCGTKVVSRRNYELIAANRAYFGDFDPFGDFDLLFGAAKLNLRIIDLPIRYRERVYGETNIARWTSGVILLRMVIYASRRLKFV